MDLSKYGLDTEDKYKKVRNSGWMFKHAEEFCWHGIRFKCPMCGLVRYLLGKDAKFYEKSEAIRCKNCASRCEYKDKLPHREAVHKCNMRNRNTSIDGIGKNSLKI